MRRNGHPEYESQRLTDLPCDPTRDDSPAGHLPYWMGHCRHWQHPGQRADGDAKQGVCCRCGKGRDYEVTGLKAFVHERRSITQLLADWAGIDLDKIEAEKRQMLAIPAPAKNGGAA